MNLEEASKQLFFVVGCPRSGTTLLQIILSCNPKVMLPPETGFYSILYADNQAELGELTDARSFDRALDKVLAFYRIKDLNLDVATVKEKCLQYPLSWETIFLAILSTFAEKHNVSRVGEKSPRHILYLDMLQDRFPEAKFVHLVRDPRAVVLSLKKVSFGSKDIKSSCCRWRKTIDIHNRNIDVLGESRYRLIHYEDLVANSESVVSDLCAFLGLDYVDEMIHPEQRTFTGYNERYESHMVNTKKPIFRKSIEKWKSELAEWEILIIQDELKDYMAQMGYEPQKLHAAFPNVRYHLRMLPVRLRRRFAASLS